MTIAAKTRGDPFMDAVDAAAESILDPAIMWGFYRGRKHSQEIYSRIIAGFRST